MIDTNSFGSRASHKITFQKKVSTTDNYGGNSITWQDVIIVWAIIEPIKSSENFNGYVINSTTTSKIIVRYQSVLADMEYSTAMRIKYGSRYYNIHSLSNLSADMKHEGTSYHEIVAENVG